MSVQVLDLFTCCVAPARQEAIGSRPKITRAMIGDPLTDTFQHLTHVGAGDDYSAVKTVGPAKSAGPTPNFQSRFTNLQPLPNVQQNSVPSSQLSTPNTPLQDHNSSTYREADRSSDPRFQISSHHSNHSTSVNAPPVATNSKLQTSEPVYPPPDAVDPRHWRILLSLWKSFYNLKYRATYITMQTQGLKKPYPTKLTSGSS